MRVHHLNCCTLCPTVGPSRMVCHCLLVEGRDGLILVDTGLGVADVEHPVERLGRTFVVVGRPKLSTEECAVSQVERLGFRLADVRHIVLTHMDLDHAGGLADFPAATVHVLGDELTAARARRTLREKHRYQPAQWPESLTWKTYPGSGGERWFGFEAVRAAAGLDDLLLVPLLGHTLGHAGIAIKADDGWMLDCGDAYFFHEEMAPNPRCTPALALFQRMMAMDDEQRRANQARLRELVRGGEVDVFCAHSAEELDRHVS